MTKNRTYSELSKLSTFKERFDYLKLGGRVGDSTFGYDRYLNQIFYNSDEWKSVRDQAIIRDHGCELGIEGMEIPKGRIIHVHHMNPITKEDILSRNPDIYNLEYLITVSDRVHKGLTYGDGSYAINDFSERSPGDTCLWRKDGKNT